MTDFPLVQGLWGHVQSGALKPEEEKRFTFLERTALSALTGLAGIVACIATPIFLILDLLYLAAKGCGCLKEREKSSLQQRAITDKTGGSSSSDESSSSEELPKGGDPRPAGKPPAYTPLPITPASQLIPAHRNQILTDRNRKDADKLFYLLEEHVPGDGFLGVDEMKRMMAAQAEAFRGWAEKGEWRNFSHHLNHYDWWTFPICRPSEHLFKYTVSLENVAMLKQDPVYMENFRTCVKLVVKSWGWDLENNFAIYPRADHQDWDFWDVRLGKMATSLRLFGEWDLFARLQNYVKQELYHQRQLPEAWVMQQLLIGPQDLPNFSPLD